MLDTTMFGTDDRSLSSSVRDLLTAGTGAAKGALLADANALAQSVLPLADLPAQPSSSQTLHPPEYTPVKVSTRQYSFAPIAEVQQKLSG